MKFLFRERDITLEAENSSIRGEEFRVRSLIGKDHEVCQEDDVNKFQLAEREGVHWGDRVEMDLEERGPG